MRASMRASVFSTGCCGATLLSFALAMPAAAQSDPARPAPAITVTGKAEEKKSDWKRAEADHVVVFSQGSAGELKRVTKNLETLNHLMTRIYRRGDSSDDALKLQVVLVDSRRRLDELGLREVRTQQGPFAPVYSGGLYYDPQATGALLVVARTDQVIDLNTTRRFNQDCDDYQAEGGDGLCSMAMRPNLPPVARSWEASLYAGYAQHFLQTYVPVAYPRWYLDGIGALFSSITPMGRGLDYAEPPVGYRNVFRSYGYPDVAAILSGRYLTDPDAKTGWSPYAAWLLAHYFVFGTLKPERSAAFQAYIAALRNGTPMADAAKGFGDMVRLQRDIQSYGDSDIHFAHAGPPEDPIADPLVTTLSADSGAIVDARLELEAHLGAPPATADIGWLTALDGRMARLGSSADAALVAAEANCRSGRASECGADADRAAAVAPDRVDALAWKGVAQTDAAIAAPAATRAGLLSEARKTLTRAITLDATAPLPLIAYFESFTKAGERAPDDAMRGMTIAIRSVPDAPGPRLILAQELVRRGNPDIARRLMGPILNGAYDSPERQAAMHMFGAAPAGTAGAAAN